MCNCSNTVLFRALIQVNGSAYPNVATLKEMVATKGGLTCRPQGELKKVDR